MYHSLPSRENSKDLWICAWSSPCALSHKVSPLTPNLGAGDFWCPKRFEANSSSKPVNTTKCSCHYKKKSVPKTTFQIQNISLCLPQLFKVPGHSRRRFFLRITNSCNVSLLPGLLGPLVREAKFTGRARETKAPTAGTDEKLLDRAFLHLLDCNITLEHSHSNPQCRRISDNSWYPLVIWHSYWKWPFISDFPIKNGDFP